VFVNVIQKFRKAVQICPGGKRNTVLKIGAPRFAGIWVGGLWKLDSSSPSSPFPE
jgi:hypothetical protein